MEVNQDIKPRTSDSAYVEASFDKGKEALERASYRIISLQENARLRMQEGSKADISQYGNYTREGVIYVPNKGKFLTKNSPIMANAKKAINCHRDDGNGFYLIEEQVESALEDSVELSVKPIPTNRFGEDRITNYAFGEDAKKYGEFLKEYGINSMPIFTTNLEREPFARQVWFHWIGGGYSSALNGINRNFHNYNRVRGIRESAEGTSQKRK